MPEQGYDLIYVEGDQLYVAERSSLVERGVVSFTLAPPQERKKIIVPLHRVVEIVWGQPLPEGVELGA